MANSVPNADLARFDRTRSLSRLRDETFDVLVVGGGITGAGVALDAASRGLKTALIEKDDFASGTSSKSSKLIHGGLRYLQQHEYRLVYENLAERQRLLENAPHLVSPLPFLIPIFGKDGVVNRSVARVYLTALWLYDLTGGVRIGRRHERITPEEALAHMPTLKADRLVTGFLYWDARSDDARLTLSVLRTAALHHDAVVVNHTRAEGVLTSSDGSVTGCIARPDRGDAIDIRAKVVVNAAGVWSDEVRTMDEGRDPHSIRPAKGIHITVPADAFPCDIAAVIPVRSDKRSIFVVSWGEQVYLGTTDTSYEGPLDDPACLPEDVDYILAAANGVSTRTLTRNDITGIWTGLRPLLAPAEGKSSPSERTADLSRRHTVRTSHNGVVTITGGKLTTYRKMAEDTVDVVVKRLGGSAGPCVTKRLRLQGAGSLKRQPAVVRPDSSAPLAPQAHLAARYGAEADAVWALGDAQSELRARLTPTLPYLGVEVVWAARVEMACSVADILDRRTQATFRDARGAIAMAPAVAALLGAELGWGQERIDAEVEENVTRLRNELLTAGLDPDGGPHHRATAESRDDTPIPGDSSAPDDSSTTVGPA